MNVEWDVSFFCVGIVLSRLEVKGDVQEIYFSDVCFDCDL